MGKTIESIETVKDQEAEEILTEIEEQEKELGRLALNVNNAKLASKDAKEAYDAGVTHLRALARTRLEDNPLFDAVEEDENDEEV